MSGVEVFFMVIGAWTLITLAIAAGLAVFQYVIIPIANFIVMVRDYAKEKTKRLGERGQ